MPIKFPGIYLRYLLIIILALNFMLTGCDISQPQPERTEQANTRTVTDCAGRSVTVPANPQRIACLCPEAGHAMAMYGQGDKIVAAVGGMQRDLLLVKMYPNIKNVPVPKVSEAINIEELAACQPDLVFVKADTVSNPAEMDKLNKVGIPAIAIGFNSMQEQQEAMQLIALIVGAEAEGQKYNKFYQQTITMVAERVDKIAPDDRVLIYHSLNEATRTDIEGSLPADWTRAAGVINVSVDENLKFAEGKYYASLEQILLWDPDYILVNDPNVVGYIMQHEQWRPLQAVKNRRVLAMPNGISRWGHFSSLETPLAVMWTANTLYPDKFTDIDMVAETKYFYKEFFRMDLNDETVQKILSGEGMRVSKN
mgnify:FL=1